jgi:AcrR family transcriptional regulator
MSVSYRRKCRQAKREEAPVPKINAPTVAEHRDRRRAALVNAGRDILAAEGADAVTPAAVGAAAGIARSSVYQYFDSSVALLAAIVEESFPNATATIREAVDAADSPAARITAYVSASLDLATNPEHRSFDAATVAALPPDFRDRVDALHREQYAPLVAALRDAGAPDPALAANLVGGLLTAAVRAVAAGADVETARAALLAFIDHGVLGDAG